MPKLSATLRNRLSKLLIGLAGTFGTRLRDAEGNVLCRAFIISWRGYIHLIGVPRLSNLKPVPIARQRATYWRQSLVWEQAGPPDFPNIRTTRPGEVTGILHVVICHLPPAQTTAIYERWAANEAGTGIVIAYGGTEENFKALPPTVQAIWIPDASLRTKDHARERQEYTGVFREASRWLAGRAEAISHVHIVEFDVLPVTPSLGDHLLDALRAEDADVIGYGMLDIRGSIHPHNSHEMANREFLAALESISVREVKDRLITMLGCSTFWTRECFEEVASLKVPRVYLEIGMASLPHHLGYRVRPISAVQQRYVSFEGDHTSRIGEFRREGAWSVHPCKEFWRDSTAAIPAPGRKLRLLLCSHTYSTLVNRAKAAALSEWFEVMVCFPDLNGVQIMGRDGSAQDGEVSDAPYEIRRLQRWPRSVGFTRCFAKGLGEVFSQWRPDIVLCEEEPWSLLRWQSRVLSWKAENRPLFVEFTWENLSRPGLKGKLLMQLYRLAAMTSDGVVCGNRGAEDLFAKAGLPAWKSLRTGQLGVEPSEHPVADAAAKRAWRARLELPDDGFVVGFCGRFVEEKGIFDLLEAVEQVRRTHPRVCLVYLGGGALEADLKAKAAERPWFRLLPPVPHLEVPQIICHFDLFILPSKPQLDPAKGIWEEQFGHVLIEAMMCGVACIGSNSGGIPEVLEEERRSLFSPGDVQELALLISGLVSSPENLADLAAVQRIRTLEKWTHEALAARYAEFILGLYSPS